MQVTLALLLVTVLLPPVAVAVDLAPARGAALVNACAACHGPDGRSQGTIPAIDQLSPEDFSAALRAFRSDTRTGTVMNRLAKGVDDADISAMAAYLASRPGR
jgi:sulfide dehydrogenase cytochrome subunit